MEVDHHLDAVLLGHREHHLVEMVELALEPRAVRTGQIRLARARLELGPAVHLVPEEVRAPVPQRGEVGLRHGARGRHHAVQRLGHADVRRIRDDVVHVGDGVGRRIGGERDGRQVERIPPAAVLEAEPQRTGCRAPTETRAEIGKRVRQVGERAGRVRALRVDRGAVFRLLVDQHELRAEIRDAGRVPDVHAAHPRVDPEFPALERRQVDRRAAHPAPVRRALGHVHGEDVAVDRRVLAERPGEVLHDRLGGRRRGQENGDSQRTRKSGPAAKRFLRTPHDVPSPAFMAAPRAQCPATLPFARRRCAPRSPASSRSRTPRAPGPPGGRGPSRAR